MDNPKPIAPEDAVRLLDIQDVEQRAAYAQQLGVENVVPTLPHSPYVKVKKTGRILPWNELLAEQGTLVECCDEHGNTDPEAWQPLVKEGIPNEEAHRMAQSIIVTQAREMSETHRVAGAVNMVPRQYPEDAVPYSDILDASTSDALQALRAMAV